jgi:signal transduction histidine kinase/streptogramin lyase
VFRGGRFQTLIHFESGSSRVTSSRSGGVWFCSGFHLYKYTEGGTLEDRGAFIPKRPGTEPSVIIEGRDGAVWIGTTFSGLFRYDGSSFESIHTEHPEILSLLEDAEGNVWVGTGGGGLNQVRPRAVTLETAEAGLPFEAVQSLCEDTNGIVWAATQNGALARHIRGQWQVLPMDASWVGDATSLCADPSGDVWVGTRFHRLLCWRRDKFINWGDVSQVKGQTIRTLVMAKNGDVWLGADTPSAVQRLHEGKLDDFKLPPDLRVIRASAQDAAGNVWFGTSKGVLMRVKGNQLVDETERMVGSPQPIRCLYGTPDGSLWIGFAGFGVGRIKNDRLIGVKQGLFDDYVSQIVADGHGWLWFAADRGIFKVRQQEMEAVADNHATRVRSIHYGQADGLPSLQANFGNSPIALRSRDGRLWFAMRTALAVVDPKNLHENSKPPPVRLSRVTVNERTVAEYLGVLSSPQESSLGILELDSTDKGLRVPPDHRRIDFDFTALSFVGPENVGFRHRLVNFDDDWVESGGTERERTALYLRLPPGKFEFQVSACNSEGVWNEAGAKLAFEVMPFFWQTWWFRSLAIFTFTAIIIAVVRYVSFRRLRAQLLHLEQQAALHKERARIAKDIHDDLGANLTQISFLGELAQQDRGVPDKAGEHIEKISTTARLAVKSLDEIVWAVNPRNDTLAHFIDYTGQYALDYLRVAGIRCRLDLPEQTPARELSTDVRHNLFLVVKEAINNTVKHAHATELKLQIEVSDEKLAITIEDNGCGFDQPPTDDGADGLRNMRQRLADIGGQCWIHGRPGGGAKVLIEVPWTQIQSDT